MNGTDNEYIELYPAHAMYNAGLVGLYDVLMTQALDMQDNDAVRTLETSTSCLRIPKRLLYGIEKAWVDTVIERYRPQSACAGLISSYKKLSYAAGKGEVTTPQADALLAAAEKKLASASYKSAREAIRTDGDEYDPLPAVKALARDKNGDANARILDAEPVFAYLERHSRLLMMKDAAYTVINQYWKGVSFLNQNKNKADMEPLFGEFFVRPIESAFAAVKTRDYKCFECNGDIPFDYTQRTLTWVCDCGTDDRRKRSNYWNFKPDNYICPICALAYSCIPLGFTIVGGQGMFVNTNSGIMELLSANNFRKAPDEKLKSMGVDAEETNSLIAFKRLRARAYLEVCENTNAKKQLESVQTLLRRRSGGDDPVYRAELLTRSQLFAIKGCEGALTALTKITVKMGKRYLNLFDEVMENLVSNRNQHTLIQTIIYAQLKDNRPLFPAWFLLRVQIYQKGGENVEKTDRMMKLTYAVAHEGTNLRNAIGSDEGEKNNKLRGYVYKLLNYVKAGNRKDFLDTVIRMYAGLAKELPTGLLMNLQGDDETFTVLAQSYIIGLSGDIDKKKDEKKEEEKA